MKQAGSVRARRAARGAPAAVLGAVALLASGCAEKALFWSRDGSGQAEYDRTAGSCSSQSERQAAVEQESQPAPGVGGSTGSGYGQRDRTTSPGSENEKRRLERRVRYYFGECMEARGWKSNTSGQGFPGR